MPTESSKYITDPQMWCDQCEKWITIVDGVTAIYDRDYWWCAKHVEIFKWVDGKPIVFFPSPGKLIPGTILYCEETDGSYNP